MTLYGHSLSPRCRLSPCSFFLFLSFILLFSGSLTTGREPKKAEASRIAQKYIKPDRRHKSLGPMWRNYYVTHGWGSGELKRGGRKGDSEDYTKKNLRGSGAFPRGTVAEAPVSSQLFKPFQRARFRPCVCQSSLSLNYIKLY